MKHFDDALLPFEVQTTQNCGTILPPLQNANLHSSVFTFFFPTI